jgi:hypothetical protein
MLEDPRLLLGEIVGLGQWESFIVHSLLEHHRSSEIHYATEQILQTDWTVCG